MRLMLLSARDYHILTGGQQGLSGSLGHALMTCAGSRDSRGCAPHGYHPAPPRCGGQLPLLNLLLAPPSSPMSEQAQKSSSMANTTPLSLQEPCLQGERCNNHQGCSNGRSIPRGTRDHVCMDHIKQSCAWDTGSKLAGFHASSMQSNADVHRCPIRTSEGSKDWLIEGEAGGQV